MIQRTPFLPENLILLDPSLMSTDGHHLPAATDLALQCRDIGVQFRAFCNVSAPAEVLDLPAKPLFQNHAYMLNTIADEDEEYAAVVAINNSVLYELVQISQGSLSAKDFILFPVVTYNNVIGICHWIASFPPDTSPKFGLGFTFQLDWNTDGTIGRSKAYAFRIAFDLVRDRQRGNIVTTCETAALGLDYENATGTVPVIAPIPTATHRILDDKPLQRIPVDASAQS